MLDFVRLSICPISIRLDEEYLSVIAEAVKDFRKQFESDHDEFIIKPQPIKKFVF